MDAERMLKQAGLDGCYLLRESESQQNNISISFRSEGRIKHCRITLEDDQYYIGNSLFEDLPELVDYYSKYPLYRRTTLKHPLNQTILKKMMEERAANEAIQDEQIYEDNYRDANAVMDCISVRAIYQYTPAPENRDAHLSFTKGAIIRNVTKLDADWWRGEYCDRAGLFPANFVEDLETQVRVEDDNKKFNGEVETIKIRGCRIERFEAKATNIEPNGVAIPYGIKITPAGGGRTYLLALDSSEEYEEWLKSLQSVSEQAEEVYQSFKTEQQQLQRVQKIERTLSDLVGYCRPVQFRSFEESISSGKFYEMSSFPEQVAMKRAKKEAVLFVRYTKRQMCRTYPMGKRVDSSNYEPQHLWNVGAQMVALNFQTPDRPMQIYRGKFRQNGNCGYVLKPRLLRDERHSFDPNDPNTFSTTDARSNVWRITLTVIGAKHLTKRKGIVSAFVSTEVIGVNCDSTSLERTKTVPSNGVCPVWNHKMLLTVKMPELAMIRFVVQDEDMFQDALFVAQACVPVESLNQGYRCVPLCNRYGEEMPLSALMVHVQIEQLGTDASNEIYSAVSMETIFSAQLEDADRNLAAALTRKQHLLYSRARIEEVDACNREISQWQKKREECERQLASARSKNATR
eukprot:comp16027_c1_seq2/m.13492 comp16027_c1_seq2/g.13492  ORF comp16027_c1_seq2/g.13492 comp16027_c1_seq2/m.13492 type:complete len:630 (-) comp16027_c1_seq2:37-1926(-)